MRTKILVLALTLAALPGTARESLLNSRDSAFFATDQAAAIGRQVMAYQRCTGGWPKNIDMTRPMTEDEIAAVLADRNRRNDSTTDNNATTTQMEFLARLYKATADTAAMAAVRRGADYLLSGQYANGGWPQFWPVQRDYQIHITYNDGAMVNTLSTIRDLRDGVGAFDAPGLVDDALRARLDSAFRRGIDCILATQIRVDGKPTVWCQQHDRETLLPTGARAFELASFASTESMGIVWLLMEIPDPSQEIVDAIEGAMEWFEKTRIDNYRYERRGPQGTRLVPDSTSTVWARYYDLESCRPFVCDRDGVARRSLDEIGQERRDGYAWYSSAPLSLIKKYNKWKKKRQKAAAKAAKAQ